MIYTDIHKNTPRTSLPLYEWVNGIALNGTKDADNVNYFEYTMFKGNKATYRNSWATDIPTTQDNIIELVKGGRARWKIENEAFNTLKNQGYHLEHNFGHRDKYLAYNSLLFNFLAFFTHQILELSDIIYIRYKRKVTSPCFCHTIAIIMTIIIYMIRVMYYVA